MFKKNHKLLFFLLVFFTVSSCMSKQEVKKTHFQAVCLPEIQNESKMDLSRDIIKESINQYVLDYQPPEYRTDSGSQRILLIGDSMSKWLRYRLGDYCKANGHGLYTVTWVSGNTEWFAQYDTLDYYIEKNNISYVFLILGANELFIKDFAKHRAAYVDKIIGRLSEVKWIWVGPPNWKKDKGINNYLLEKLSDKKFFVSKDLKFNRQADGMHPTVASCSMWVDSIVSWIKHTSTSRIKLNIPDSSFHLKPAAVVLKPLY